MDQNSGIHKKPGMVDHWFFGPVLSQRSMYLQIIVASVCVNLFALVSAFYVMTVYDRVIPNESTDTLVVLTVGVLLVLFFDFLMKTIRGQFIDKAGSAIDIEVAETIFHHVSRNEKLIANQPAGAMASTIKEFDLLKEFLASATLVSFVDLPFAVLFLVILYVIGGWVVAAPAIIVVLVIASALLVQPIVRRLANNAQMDGMSKQALLVEMLHGLETLKTLPGLDMFRARWMASVEEQTQTQTQSRFWAQLTSNIAQSGQQLSQVGIVVLGVYLIIESNLTMGALIACVILSGRILSPLGQITNLLGRLHQTFAAYRSLDALFAVESSEVTKQGLIRHAQISGSVALEHLSFRHGGKTAPLFENLSVSIKPGERVALLGKIGSGKSTLLRLMSGLLSPTTGSVKVDGIDLSHLHPDDIRKHIGLVHQQPTLFSGTLKENLLLGNPSASDEEIVRVSNLLGVNQIADSLPNGYDTFLIERGQQLSGGQRQSVCIARMMLADPKIVLLDEPTSAMDNQSEAEIIQALSQWLEGRTAIVVTHRGSILQLAGRVIAVDGGKIVADGKPDEFFSSKKTARRPS